MAVSYRIEGDPEPIAVSGTPGQVEWLKKGPVYLLKDGLYHPTSRIEESPDGLSIIFDAKGSKRELEEGAIEVVFESDL